MPTRLLAGEGERRRQDRRQRGEIGADPGAVGDEREGGDHEALLPGPRDRGALGPGQLRRQLAEQSLARRPQRPCLGSYEGRLKHNIIDAFPPGFAVDNSGTTGQGRVYVTSGNSETASVMIYAAHAAGAEAIALQGIEKLFCRLAMPSGLGAEAPLPEPLTCVGDSCQHLPSEPRDPTLTTLLDAAGDGPVRFFDTNRSSHVLKLRGHHRRGRISARRVTARSSPHLRPEPAPYP